MRIKQISKILICLSMSMALAAGQFVFTWAEGEEETDDNLYVYVNADSDKAAEVISRINSERKRRGIATLNPDQTLADAALIKAAESILYFEHARPNGGSWDSVSGRVMGENLGRGTDSVSEIMKLWMESPGHKENILRSSFHSVGVSCIEVGGTYYWVQLFGTAGGNGMEEEANGIVTAALDLPTEEEGGTFLLDYRIYVDGKVDYYGYREDEMVLDLDEDTKLQLCLFGDYLEFDSSKLKWSIDDAGIAEIDANGLLSIKDMGRTTVRVASGSRERASIEIDSRADINDMYVIENLPFVTVLGANGPLKEGEDYRLNLYDADGDGGVDGAEIRGIDKHKGLVRTAHRG